MNKEIAELKAENERLKEEKGGMQILIDNYIALTQKYHQTLQEIKAIAEELLEKGLEPQSVEHQLRLRGKRELASIILDLITKAESEG